MDFKIDCLRAHNELRQKHGALPLTLNSELCQHSQRLADYLVRKSCFGENTYCIYSKDSNRLVRAEEPVKTWYSDIEKHNFEEEPLLLSSGRFTQLVWKSTKEVGVGVAKFDGKTVIVANYFPPGNISGQFKENVNPIPETEINNIESEMSKMMEELTAIQREESDADFKTEFVEVHNDLRKRHGAPPLVLDEKLCAQSQLLADYLVKRSDYGENTYCISSTDPNRLIMGDEPVKSWYNEIEIHNFLEEPNSLSAGKFTQLVWKETRELGVGVAKYENKTVVVATYYPTGNISGEFLKNVAPASDGSVSPETKTKNLQNGSHGNFDQDFLNAHNEYRKRHGVEPLELHEDLCKYSQEWAIYLASKDTMEPSENCPYGENIYSVGSSNPLYTITGRVPVDFWYDEVKHKEDADKSQMENFSQVISNTSHFLGVGIARSQQGNIYVVANYSSDRNLEEHPPEKLWLKMLESISSAQREFDQIALDGLEYHNKYRRLHGTPPLILSKELCKYAQKWAELLSEINAVQYPPTQKYEMNIFEHRAAQEVSSAEVAVRTWYNKCFKYNYKNPVMNSDTDSFIKLIWKSGQEMGMAKAMNEYGYVYVVAVYTPRCVFMVDKLQENVLPPLQS